MLLEHSKRRVALVTGAASGLGAQFAERLARDRFELVLVDWKADLLEEGAKELRREFRVPVHVIGQDLTDPEGVVKIHRRCEELNLRIDFLVNNAGFHLNKLLHELPWSVVRDNIQLLLHSVVEMTHRFLPAMIAQKEGIILNVCSVSGFMPGGVRLATYNASKAFLIPFSESLNFELTGTGVHVTAICPGFMRTSLFENCSLMDVRNAVPGFMWLNPREVADKSVRAAMRGCPLYVVGMINHAMVLAAKFAPRKLLRDRTRILHRLAHARMALFSREKVQGKERRRVAVVTGASAGIGASFCDVLASRGYNLILIARREKLLQEKAAQLTQRHGIEAQTIAQDMSAPDAIESICAAIEKIGWPVDILVNNAGAPITELFHRMSWDEVKSVLQLNISSVAGLSHALVSGMISRGEGLIINIASLAAFEPGSFRSSLYSSSKIFQVAFSESIAAELDRTGVFASAICPGFTRTEWVSKNKIDPLSIPKVLWMDSNTVAQAGLGAALQAQPVTIVATPVLRMIYTLFRFIPRRWIGGLLSRKRRRSAAAVRP